MFLTLGGMNICASGSVPLHYIHRTNQRAVTNERGSPKMADNKPSATFTTNVGRIEKGGSLVMGIIGESKAGPALKNPQRGETVALVAPGTALDGVKVEIRNVDFAGNKGSCHV